MATYAESVCISPNKTVTSGRNILYLVIHTVEAPEAPNTAENIAQGWFARREAQSSAHWCLDSNSRVRCVEDKDVAWAAPGANSTGLQYELAGYAAQSSSQWRDAYSLSLLDNVAQQCAKDAKKYGIPIVHLSVSDILAGKKGFIGHIDATNAFSHGVGHTDPGKSFPWDYFLNLVRKYAGQSASNASTSISGGNVSVLALGSRGDRVRTLQRTFNDKWIKPNKWRIIATDGEFGPDTMRVVKAFQKSQGLVVDGVAGPKTFEKIKLKWGVVI